MSKRTLEIQRISDMQRSVESAIYKHSSWYFFQGVIFVIAGILAIVLPSATAISFELLIGALLTVSGFIQGLASLKSKTHWWSLISAITSFTIGGFMLLNPMVGAITIATILAIFLTIEGFIELFLSLQFRPIKNWGWLLCSGLASLGLAVLIFVGWPKATVVFLGIVIGINLLFYGISLLAITICTKRKPN